MRSANSAGCPNRLQILNRTESTPRCLRGGFYHGRFYWKITLSVRSIHSVGDYRKQFCKLLSGMGSANGYFLPVAVITPSTLTPGSPPVSRLNLQPKAK